MALLIFTAGVVGLVFVRSFFTDFFFQTKKKRLEGIMSSRRTARRHLARFGVFIIIRVC